MSDYDAERATRQHMTDALVRTVQAHADGDGHGWHLTALNEVDGPATVLTFETPRPLRGWRHGDDGHLSVYDGPHRVTITVQTATEESTDDVR